MKPAPIVLERGYCTCTAAPMAHGGLEGYMDNMDYKYELMMDSGIPSAQWYRVYHHQDPDEDVYYQTCNSGIFKQHFRIFRVDTKLL
jgi:hypothetical protein